MSWRPSRRIHIVAAAASLVALGTVLWLFDTFGILSPSNTPERQLIASIDLRIGNPAAVQQQGEDRAKADVEAGLLQLQTFAKAPAGDPAESPHARQLKERWGFAWVYKTTEPTALSHAFVDGYNHVMQAEIERRHGKAVLEQLLREDRARLPPEARKEKAA